MGAPTNHGAAVIGGPEGPDDPAPNAGSGSSGGGAPRHLRALDDEPNAATIRVLVVDDDVSIRTLLRMLLSMDPRLSVVGEAADGDEALEELARLDPDLMLLDLAMPNRNGLEVLRSLGGRDRPTVVVLTGFDDPDVRAQALEAGAKAFLTKGDGFATLGDDLVTIVESS
jgi:DNA-binding NarL/FixJ family response regulator